MDPTLIRSQESDGINPSTRLTPHESSHSNEIQPWNEDCAQVVLILVGLIASGKSTFAQALESNFPQFRRCNQDDLGDRKAVERLVRASLKQGLSVCIDRTNFDEIQRSHWINIAREFPRARLWCIVFNTPTHICRERLQLRTNHPTIHSPEKGIQVLYRFQNMLVPPSADEGFERIFNIEPEDHPSAIYSSDELRTLLVQVATSSPPMRSGPQRGIREYFDASPPHGAGRKRGWRERNPSRGRILSSRNSGFGRYNGRDGSSGSSFRPSDPHNVGRSSSYNAWKSNSVSPQADGRNPHRRGENVFQNDGRVGRAAEQALPSISRHAPDRTIPTKQSGGGAAEFPILID